MGFPPHSKRSRFLDINRGLSDTGLSINHSGGTSDTYVDAAAGQYFHPTEAFGANRDDKL